ncbi:GroES-like protein [Zopfia rhizophila CBS 207.26]|uniref:GroES-like protein n=1 Tax=Zopfia rhizophila CBS 207.26 TaxID=1314779 RepID=A0A6A6EFP0_9PEZI|nr:GroES-like protein [Zopfia rhizophila CBS 207.26]
MTGGKRPHPKDTMRAVVWEGKPFSVVVQDVPKAKMQANNDAVVRVTTAAICGTDLHVYRGIFGSASPPWPLGHEAMGIVTEIGPGVQTIKVGDRVIVPDTPDDGHLNMDPPDFSDLALFGSGGDFGGLGGCQGKIPSRH